MKFSDLLTLVRESGPFSQSKLASDLSLVTSVSLDLADVALPSSDTDELATAYMSYSPRPVYAVVLTRDEEERIERCLAALAEDIDHCLLIDSGSTDSTIARAMKARTDTCIVSAPWANDFSLQRNIAFREVHNGWLCHVDADEVLTSAHAGRLRRALSALDFLLGDHDFVVSPVIADVDGPVYTNTQRIIPADGPFRFRGRVHEHPYDRRGYAPARVQIDVRFDHSGYLPEVIEQRAKRHLYVKLDKLCRAEEPDNPKWVFYEIRDGLDLTSASAAEVRAAFAQLAEAAGTTVPAGPPGYRTERVVDSWALLCELALRLGEADALMTYTTLLGEAGRTVEATYYRTLWESSRLLGALSALVDRIASVGAEEEPANRHLVARLFDLQASLGLASGRYEVVVPAYREATARGAGQGVGEDLTRLARLLADVPGSAARSDPRNDRFQRAEQAADI